MEICYDGTRFSGWQAQNAQPEVRTIQGELEKALQRITGEGASVLGSGRTDAGVSALRQVATFRSETTIPAERLTLALNAFLPPEIRVLQTVDVSPDFHPIADAVRKRYRYLLSDSRPVFPFLKNYVWFVRKRLDAARMKSAAVHLLGKHDFAAFETTGSPRESTVRTIFDVSIRPVPFPAFWIAERGSADEKIGKTAGENLSAHDVENHAKNNAENNIVNSLENKIDENAGDNAENSVGDDVEEKIVKKPLKTAGENGAPTFADFPFSDAAASSPVIWSIEVEADGFLYNMVRAIVGTLVLFGEKHNGFDDPKKMKEIVESKNRAAAGPTAPPFGLYMVNAVYPRF